MAEITKITKKPPITTSQIATIIFAVLLGTVIAHYDDFLPYRWQTFTTADGGFSVQFPSQPKVDESQVQLSAGVTTVIHEITAQPTNTTVYTCSFFDDRRLADGSAEDALNAERDGATSGVEGTIVREQHVTFDGYPARDVEVHARGNSLIDMRLIAVGHRMYALMVVETNRERPDSKNVRKFFDSVRFSR